MYADAFFDAKRSAGSISVSRSLKSACRMGVNRISELFVAAPFKNAFVRVLQPCEAFLQRRRPSQPFIAILLRERAKLIVGAGAKGGSLIIFCIRRSG